ncbi:MAG: hypothetical protein K8R53_01180 [Bacteroidales bacterium]|nr:hypothetical protein [Bacteroidales bacterium]
MKDTIRFVKDIRILKEDKEPDLITIRARGIAELKKLIAPVLIAREYDTIPKDGLYELNFVLDNTGEEITKVDLAVDVVFRINSLPKWVKGIKIYASENSDIELL